MSMKLTFIISFGIYSTVSSTFIVFAWPTVSGISLPLVSIKNRDIKELASDKIANMARESEKSVARDNSLTNGATIEPIRENIEHVAMADCREVVGKVSAVYKYMILKPLSQKNRAMKAKTNFIC